MIKRSIVLLKRAQTFAQSPAQLRARFTQRSNHLILVLRFLLASRNGLLAPCLDRFQGDQVSAPEGGNLRHHHSFEPLSVADFDTQFPCHSLVWIMTHHSHRLADARFREKAQKRGLGKFDFKGFVQRVVEDGITCLVNEARQEDDIGLGQRGPSEKDAPRSDGGNNEEGCDTSRNDKAALVPKFRRWPQGENWREMYFDGGRCGQVAVFYASDETVAATGQGLDVT